MWDGGSEKEVKEMGDDGDEWEEGVPKPEGPREVQSQVDGDVHMADGEREENYGMDADGLAPDEDFRFDEDEEEDRHRPVVKSKLNGALSSGKIVPATISSSNPSSSTAKPTTSKGSAKLVPVAIPSKTPTKNKAKTKELERELAPCHQSSRPLTSRL